MKNSAPRSSSAIFDKFVRGMAWAIEPGPIAIAGVPSSAKNAASQNQLAPVSFDPRAMKLVINGLSGTYTEGPKS